MNYAHTTRMSHCISTYGVKPYSSLPESITSKKTYTIFQKELCEVLDATLFIKRLTVISRIYKFLNKHYATNSAFSSLFNVFFCHLCQLYNTSVVLVYYAYMLSVRNKLYRYRYR